MEYLELLYVLDYSVGDANSFYFLLNACMGLKLPFHYLIKKRTLGYSSDKLAGSRLTFFGPEGASSMTLTV